MYDNTDSNGKKIGFLKLALYPKNKKQIVIRFYYVSLLLKQNWFKECLCIDQYVLNHFFQNNTKSAPNQCRLCYNKQSSQFSIFCNPSLNSTYQTFINFRHIRDISSHLMVIKENRIKLLNKVYKIHT